MLCRLWVRRRGFTLIELLVVIAIIAILIALLLPPCIRRGRRPADSMPQSPASARPGLHNYHDSSLVFPPGNFAKLTWWNNGYPGGGQGRYDSGLMQLYSQLDNAPLFNRLTKQWNTSSSSNSSWQHGRSGWNTGSLELPLEPESAEPESELRDYRS